MLPEFVQFIRHYYQKPTGEIPLHQTFLSAADYCALTSCLDSGIVSTVGSLVDDFEQKISEIVDCPYAVATHTGTAALHLALLCSGIQQNDLVITQPFCFVASCNAIRYCGADPIFVDIERNTLGLSARALVAFLEQEAEVREDGQCYHQASRRRISHCLPVCTFGHIPEMDQIQSICDQYKLRLIVDAAEALGSEYQGQSAASWGDASVLSFNGNKIVTCGGGGMLLTHNQTLAEKARHLSVQARQQEGYSLSYDAVGYNYRMPNLNAALGLAQVEMLEAKIQQLRKLAQEYCSFFSAYDMRMRMLGEHEQAVSNFWLNALIFPSQAERDTFVKHTNPQGILTRTAWKLMTHLPMYQDCIKTSLPHAEWAEQHLVLLPSFSRS